LSDRLPQTNGTMKDEWVPYSPRPLGRTFSIPWYRRAPRNASRGPNIFRVRVPRMWSLMISVLPVTSLGMLIAQVDTSVVSLAAKPIGTDLGSAASGMQWMIDA